MILINKKVGETPLEVIKRLRVEKPELKDEKLSYAGRLDPMAEGEMLIMVGEENNRREEFLGLDKEYVATFLIGIKTDSGDALGLIDSNIKLEVTKEQIQRQIKNLLEIKKQKYPWFSAKTYKGIKLFDYFKKGNTDDVVRPSLNVTVKTAEFISMQYNSYLEIQKYIVGSIKKVNGDFRQEEILEKWEEYFNKNKSNLQTFEVKFTVSSGTFIRALSDNFDFPALLLKLNRTKIFLD